MSDHPLKCEISVCENLIPLFYIFSILYLGIESFLISAFTDNYLYPRNELLYNCSPADFNFILQVTYVAFTSHVPILRV